MIGSLPICIMPHCERMIGSLPMCIIMPYYESVTNLGFVKLPVKVCIFWLVGLVHSGPNNSFIMYFLSNQMRRGDLVETNQCFYLHNVQDRVNNNGFHGWQSSLNSTSASVMYWLRCRLHYCRQAHDKNSTKSVQKVVKNNDNKE